MTHPPISGSQMSGTKLAHAIITRECRANRGDEGAIDEALARVRTEYLACVANPKIERFHVTLTVERGE